MIASQMIQSLKSLIEKHGDLPVYVNEDKYEQYAGEAESAGVRYADEVDDREIDEENYLPERLYIKT